MERITRLQARENYTLEVEFSDGTRGLVCVKDELYGVFEPLKDPAYFAQAKIDEFGAICWPNGADLAPDAIYEDLKSRVEVA